MDSASPSLARLRGSRGGQRHAGAPEPIGKRCSIAQSSRQSSRSSTPVPGKNKNSSRREACCRAPRGNARVSARPASLKLRRTGLTGRRNNDFSGSGIRVRTLVEIAKGKAKGNEGKHHVPFENTPAPTMGKRRRARRRLPLGLVAAAAPSSDLAHNFKEPIRQDGEHSRNILTSQLLQGSLRIVPSPRATTIPSFFTTMRLRADLPPGSGVSHCSTLSPPLILSRSR